MIGTGMKEARDIFIGCLKERGLRYTSQREAILEAFLTSKNHITVEDLYTTLRKKNPNIGYATVHRNLKFLAECGIADEIKIGNNRARFEQHYGQEHHDHLICLKCGTFIEVHDKKIEMLQNKLAAANDFIPQRHKLEIYGTCGKCR